MKRIIICLLLIMIICLSGCGEIEIGSIYLSESTIELNIGETYTITATVFPEDHTELFSWKSTNVEIADVNENGVITAKAEGTATIICYSENGVTSSCTVISKEEAPSAISQLNENELWFYTYLTETMLNSFKNPSSIRIVKLYGEERELKLLFNAELQGTNGFGAVNTKLFCFMPCSTDNYGRFHADVTGHVPTAALEEMDSSVMDCQKINAALEEYWNEKGIE